ncbi:MAG: carboxylesterase/lipase family protein [Chloroflexi bacterium]|nr:carboxylesterase/lipase family protein [Chloroflexota bacterium]
MAQTQLKTVMADTPSGKVRGTCSEGVEIYRGIPYGEAERFMPPAAKTPWTGVHDGTVNGTRAPQGGGSIFSAPGIGAYFSGGRADGPAQTEQADSEDCLVLNVLTTGTAGRRPVMVYIHGGGYTGGSGALTLLSDRFVREQDVVLVGVNHRLNVLGYVYLGADDPRYRIGNAGQLDLVLALEWVRANIAAFGGDPDNVTLFGESGGGGKISTLLGMPAARGLFKRVIIESGSIMHSPSVADHSEIVSQLLEALGLAAGQSAELAKITPEEIFKAMTNLPTQSRRPSVMMHMGPVVDGITLPEQPWEPAASPCAAGVPMLVGCCKDEGTLFCAGNPKVYRLDWPGLQQALEEDALSSAEAAHVVDYYRSTYQQESASDLFFRIRTDRTMRQAVRRQARLKIVQGDAVWMYHFCWNVPDKAGRLRAFHTAELPLAMRLVAHPEAEGLSRQLAASWASFARSGDPNNTETPKWPSYTDDARVTMMFDSTSAAVANPDGAMLDYLSERRSEALL